jgi:hypothetical protein
MTLIQSHRTRSFTIAAAVLRQIRETIGSRPAEQGGPLGTRGNDVTTHFYFDRSARRTGATYSPDRHLLNRLFDTEWNPNGVRLNGFVHSHPPGCAHPSGGDLAYAGRILAAIPDLPYLYLPIVQTEPDTGRFELIPYVAVRKQGCIRVERLALIVIGDETKETTMTNEQPVAAPRAADTSDTTFERVQTAYDLKRLHRCRIIGIGIGGAAGYVEDLVRAGVGEHVLIDPDVVTETNLATQQVYRKDLGRPKVECVAERIRDINPSAHVVARAVRLEDLDDREFEVLLREPLDQKPPLLSLICGLTDSFPAQARVNRLALQFGVPSLSAQVYREGRGAEITFTYPGITPACHRCVLSSRYAAYLDEGFENTLTSHGTPIFATTRLNALKGIITMALLHHGTDHPRWGALLGRIGNRNLIQIRLDPDLRSTLGLSVFDRVFGGADQARTFCDEVVWLPQEPDRADRNGRPTCPDCGGTGSLVDAAGSFADTRIMRTAEVDHAAVS